MTTHANIRIYEVKDAKDITFGNGPALFDRLRNEIPSILLGRRADGDPLETLLAVEKAVALASQCRIEDAFDANCVSSLLIMTSIVRLNPIYFGFAPFNEEFDFADYKYTLGLNFNAREWELCSCKPWRVHSTFTRKRWDIKSDPIPINDPLENHLDVYAALNKLVYHRLPPIWPKGIREYFEKTHIDPVELKEKPE